jgi:multicomponent K+:H+ antiporter subunit E
MKMLSHVLPSPLLSLALFIAWPMLNQAASPGQLLIAAALAIALPLLTRALRPEPPRVGRVGVAMRLAGTLAIDIVKSNIAVARLILGDERRITPRFVWVPLSMRSPHGIVALAGVVTMTPGTLSADLSEDRRHLLVHAFDVDDDAAQATLVADIQQRYEAPLRLIFEGHRP